MRGEIKGCEKMSTLTFRVVLRDSSSKQVLINIIGTNLYIDYGDGTTTTQEPNTDGIREAHRFLGGSGERTYNVTITGNIIGLGNSALCNWAICDISLPEGLQTIGSACLNSITPKKIIIPSTVTTIAGTFLLGSAVEEVVFLSKNLKTIGHSLLKDNTTVKSVKLPEGLEALGSFAFANCTGLQTLEAPSTLTQFPTLSSSFTNVQLETLKMGGGPINNPPITNNTKIIVPLNKLQDFLSHPSYPNERERYDIYGKNLSEKIYALGMHLAENLQNKNIIANANEGLTTLANKIPDIDAPNYKELTYKLLWNDNDNEFGLRPSQTPTLLLANNEVIGGCLLPQDDMTNIPQEIYDLADIQVSANNCGTFAELQAIIDEANDGDTITLEKDYKNAGDEGPLKIDTKALHIIGNGHILDANNVTIVMEGAADGIVLEDVSFINGNGITEEWEGGGYCGWSDTLIDCIFINNQGYFGGACRVGQETNISNCIFINNVSYGDEWGDDNSIYGGGGIAVIAPNADTNIRECIFINNIAKHGGGIFVGGADEIIDIYDCIFDDISTLYHANNIQSKYSYTAQVPESDLNGEEITYTWEPLKLAREYAPPHVNINQDVSSTTMTPVQIMLTVQGDIFNSYNNNQFIFSNVQSAPIIDWGDNTTEVYDKSGFLHHVFSDGKDKHTITIDGNITALGISCFNNNASITNIVFLDDNIKFNNTSLFSGCSSLTSIVLPDKLTSLPIACFQQCSALENIVLPNSITSIASSCFKGCSSLTNIVLSNTLTSLPDYCLQDCSSLTSVTLPNGLTDVGRACFQNCSSLQNINLPENIVSLGQYCFYGCSNLTSVTLPSGLTDIGKACFQNCSSLTNIILPNTITSIGQQSFGNTGLTNITIPSTVANIGRLCFASCSRLTDVTFQNPIPPNFEEYVFFNARITIHVPQGAKSAYETALEDQPGTHDWTVVEAN